MTRLVGLDEFVQVVESGSFSAAAERLGVSKSYVSNQVRRLEDRLQARLLHRTTRKIGLTEVGENVFARAKTLMEEMEDLELSTRELQAEPRGHLSVSLPPVIGERYIAPIVAGYVADHPDISVHVTFTTRMTDLIDEGFDLAVRLSASPAEGLVARRLAEARFSLYASPAYVERSGEPRSPEDLSRHECITFGQHGDSSPGAWTFARQGDQSATTVRVRGRWRCDNAEGMVVAARRGLGLLYLPDFFVVDAVRRGELLPLMTQWTHSPVALWLVYAHRRHLSRKIRSFVDRLVARFRPHPPWAAQSLERAMRGAGRRTRRG